MIPFDESRTELYAHFVRQFADTHSIGSAVAEKDLADLAAALNSRLPASYVQFMHQHGPVYCPSILRLTIECALEHPDIRRMLATPHVIHRSRELWSQYLPGDRFVFASDCMGNALCFGKSGEERDDAEISFYSCQSGELVDLGESLDSLLRWYLEHVRQTPARAATGLHADG